MNRLPHPKGDAYRVITAIRDGEQMPSGAPRLERALALLERRQLIVLFPRPAITEHGLKLLAQVREQT